MPSDFPSLTIAAQYTTDAAISTFVRPYENKAPVGVALHAASRSQALPEPGYWRVTLDVSLTGAAEERELFTARVAQEVIVSVAGATADELERILAVQVPGRMFAYARTQMSTLSLNSGYGPLLLPPVSDEYLASVHMRDVSSEHTADEQDGAPEDEWDPYDNGSGEDGEEGLPS